MALVFNLTFRIFIYRDLRSLKLETSEIIATAE